ncbi:MAG: alanine racemase [Ruminococcus sp.]|nr:alanine racemase [Ruminococcus sp.]
MMQNLIEQNKTAFYTFNIKTLKQRIEFLKSFLPKNVALCYAVKANTFIIKEAAPLVERLEVCSPGEEVICRKLGVPSSKTVISGVYKTPEFIETLVADINFGGIFTVESQQQYQLLCSLGEKYNRRLTLLLRLTNASQFGISKQEIKQMIAEREKYKNIDVAGIQYFSGTQKSSIKKLKREIEKLDAFLIELKDELDFTARELEYGTGFPVSYFDEEEFDEHELLSQFSNLLEQMKSKPKITLEVGRSIAASCGKYYTHVVDKKTNKGQNYLLIDGGMHHIVYFGQHMAMRQPQLSVYGKEMQPKTEQWNICGSLCSMNDIIAKQTPLPEIEIGDTLIFENTGAYCMTEGISLFLSRDIPSVYLIDESGKLTKVRETFETAQLNLPVY